MENAIRYWESLGPIMQIVIGVATSFGVAGLGLLVREKRRHDREFAAQEFDDVMTRVVRTHKPVRINKKV